MLLVYYLYYFKQVLKVHSSVMFYVTRLADLTLYLIIKMNLRVHILNTYFLFLKVNQEFIENIISGYKI